MRHPVRLSLVACLGLLLAAGAPSPASAQDREEVEELREEVRELRREVAELREQVRRQESALDAVTDRLRELRRGLDVEEWMEDLEDLMRDAPVDVEDLGEQLERLGERAREAFEEASGAGDARIRTSETSAVGKLRILGSSQQIHRDTGRDENPGHYASSLAELAGPDPANALIAERLADGTADGYRFGVGFSPPASLAEVGAFSDPVSGSDSEHRFRYGWEIWAVPVEPGETGTRVFYMDHSGTILSCPVGEGDPADPDNPHAHPID